MDVEKKIETWKRAWLFLGGIVVVFLFLFGTVKKDAEIVILRNGYGEGSKEVSVYLENDETIHFTVEEQEYGEEELSEAFLEGFSWARENMLLDNASAGQVRSNLNFMTEVPGGISAEWISDNEEVLGSDGTVHNEDWEEKRQELVMVTLCLTYQEEVQQEQIYVQVRGPILTKEERLLRKIQNYIEKEEEKTRKSESFTLPTSIEGVEIVQEAPVNVTGVIIIILAGCLFVFVTRKNREKEEQKKRQEEILGEYPVFVHKFLLYLGAGMNAKTAFETMILKYLKDKEKKVSVKKAVYEELFVMLNEIGAGVGEKRAYEAFGNRLGENHFIRFIGLLVQNMEKGNEGLLKALEGEEERAFSERLSRAKKAGEEAGTKLLFPMLLLMLVVMVMVMAPAMMQFQAY